MDASSNAPGPSGLNVHATVSIAIHLTGNGTSTNGSSDTPRSRKRARKPEQWKRNVAKHKRTQGEEYVSPLTGKIVHHVHTGPPCKCRKKCFDLFTDTE